jgi:cephalosporin-C deacetylase
MDHICPPSTVYAAFNHYGSEHQVDQADKQISVYPFNDHEGGGPAHEVVKLEWLTKQLETVE